MNRDELLNLLKAVQRGPVPRKKVYAYIGSPSELRPVVEVKWLQEVKVLDLVDATSSIPRNERGIKELLEQKLGRLFKEIGGQRQVRILFLHGGELLARYQVSLRDAFNFFAGDEQMVVVFLSPSKAFQRILPDYTDYHPRKSKEYFTRLLGETNGSPDKLREGEKP